MPPSSFSDIAEHLGLLGLTEPEREALYAEVVSILRKRVLSRAVVALAPKDRANLDLLLDSDPTDDAVTGFLASMVPNLDEIVAEEVTALQTRLREGMDAAETFAAQNPAPSEEE